MNNITECDSVTLFICWDSVTFLFSSTHNFTTTLSTPTTPPHHHVTVMPGHATHHCKEPWLPKLTMTTQQTTHKWPPPTKINDQHPRKSTHMPMVHPPQCNKDADGAQRHTTLSRNNYNHPGTTRMTQQRHITNPQQTHDIEGDRRQARTTVTRLCRTQPVVIGRLCFTWQTTMTALKMKTTMDEGVGGGPWTKTNTHG
ncbi:uncharacterized protein LACBIDRAFT_331087 [Laccaria bicolor S238N-H82]|uniref:Predicted protein n=1 Tax=Laccaria bicolor (strain S238N-H82 / ATCC MYA-4686) TaxID=486041 RepID=B0DNF3_LACBS|nr:uncharacterized protein LACBIDRAFT_331087 [Laccaria bicolor S238N-H82]EDR03861.1 predicted protein [Laccaria bicolor S238N-H82]|eukprot:XP_001885429.1 predicted protein [Laccaria bicolor S238N-H82]